MTAPTLGNHRCPCSYCDCGGSSWDQSSDYNTPFSAKLTGSGTASAGIIYPSGTISIKQPLNYRIPIVPKPSMPPYWTDHYSQSLQVTMNDFLPDGAELILAIGNITCTIINSCVCDNIIFSDGTNEEKTTIYPGPGYFSFGLWYDEDLGAVSLSGGTWLWTAYGMTCNSWGAAFNSPLPVVQWAHGKMSTAAQIAMTPPQIPPTGCSPITIARPCDAKINPCAGAYVYTDSTTCAFPSQPEGSVWSTDGISTINLNIPAGANCGWADVVWGTTPVTKFRVTKCCTITLTVNYTGPWNTTTGAFIGMLCGPNCPTYGVSVTVDNSTTLVGDISATCNFEDLTHMPLCNGDICTGVGADGSGSFQAFPGFYYFGASGYWGAGVGNDYFSFICYGTGPYCCPNPLGCTETTELFTGFPATRATYTLSAEPSDAIAMCEDC